MAFQLSGRMSLYGGNLNIPNMGRLPKSRCIWCHVVPHLFLLPLPIPNQVAMTVVENEDADYIGRDLGGFPFNKVYPPNPSKFGSHHGGYQTQRYSFATKQLNTSLSADAFRGLRFLHWLSQCRVWSYQGVRHLISLGGRYLFLIVFHRFQCRASCQFLHLW